MKKDKNKLLNIKYMVRKLNWALINHRKLQFIYNDIMNNNFSVFRLTFIQDSDAKNGKIIIYIDAIDKLKS